jgi:phospholipid transport system substrate-binding protein
MRKLYLFLMLLWAAPVFASDPAIDFMNNLAQEVIEQGIQGTKTHEEREVFIREKFTTILDLKSIGQFVLGTYWKKADEIQRKAFLDAFTELQTKTWSDRFGMYSGQEVVFSGTRNAQGKNQLYVDSSIPGNPPIEIIWRVRPKNDGYVIIDIVIENVSMASSYRSEYTAFLQQHQGNLQALIDELKNKAGNFKYTQGQ